MIVLEFPRGSNSIWEKSNILAFNKPVRFHCKTGGLSARLEDETRAHVRILWLDTRLMVSLSELIVQCSTAEPISQSASASHLRTRKSEDDLRLFGKFCPQSNENSSRRRSHRFLHFPCTDVRSQVLSIFDRRHGVGKPELAQEVIFFSSWVKMSDCEILDQHMVDFEKATA